jgi:hypothetical protein
VVGHEKLGWKGRAEWLNSNPDNRFRAGADTILGIAGSEIKRSGVRSSSSGVIHHAILIDEKMA